MHDIIHNQRKIKNYKFNDVIFVVQIYTDTIFKN